jgi:hemolysin III
MSYLQSRREETCNTWTHGVMAALAVLAMPFAVLGAWMGSPGAPRLAASSVTVFCLAMILMFSTSAIYHSLPADWRSKHVFNRLDHMSIFFAIAGTYTPIALVIIGGRAGLQLLLIEWSLVLAGIVFKLVAFKKNQLTEILSTAIYLMMGWSIVPFLPDFIQKAQQGCTALIVAGGIFYTTGVIFFALKRRYAHTVWHLFVDAGATCHFLAITLFIG